MTVEADIFNCLKALVGERVYPDVAPNDVDAPYIVYQQVGGEAITFVDDVVPNKKNGRIQISVWGSNRDEASEIALQIESAMTLSSAFQARPIGASISRYEPEGPMYGATQDFSVWSDR